MGIKFQKSIIKANIKTSEHQYGMVNYNKTYSNNKIKYHTKTLKSVMKVQRSY